MASKKENYSYNMSGFFQREMKNYPLATLSQRQFAVKDVIRKMKGKGIKRDYTLPKGWK